MNGGVKNHRLKVYAANYMLDLASLQRILTASGLP